MHSVVNTRSLSGINKPLSDSDAQLSAPLSADSGALSWKTARQTSKSNLNDHAAVPQEVQSQGGTAHDVSHALWDVVRSPDHSRINSTVAKHFYNPPTTSKGFDGVHATPLIALQFRDITVLRELFEREGIGDMITNVHERLAQLYPEPCWDEIPYDVLNDFL